MYGAGEILDCLSDLGDLGVEADPALAESVAAALGQVLTAHKAGYENNWELLLGVVTAAAAESPDGGLPRILERIEARCADRFPGPLDPAVGRQIKFDLAAHAGAPPHQKLVVRDGRYALVDRQVGLSWTAALVRPFVTPETDAIVEFGGGWGRNLAFLARDLPRADRTFVNCEQSANGRAASEALMAACSDLRFQARDFHFESPDVGFLDQFSNVLAFTGAAIEQIPFLHRSFIEGILDGPRKVTLVMIEPFGWQRFTNLNRFVLSRFLRKCLRPATPQEAEEEKAYVFRFVDERFHDNAAVWALSAFYNMNLLRMAGRLADGGGARVIDLRYDVYSENPLNPYSLIALTSP